jgi:hypothetical protein
MDNLKSYALTRIYLAVGISILGVFAGSLTTGTLREAFITLSYVGMGLLIALVDIYRKVK